MIVSSDFRFLQSEVFDTLPMIQHGFAVGADLGVTPIDFGDDENGKNAKNWDRVLDVLGPRNGTVALAVMNQVHGGACIEVTDGCGVQERVGDVDGIVTTKENVALVVRTADCCPVLMAAPGGIAAAHAGWRGVAQSVVPNTVEQLVASAGCRPEEIRVLIGPTIGIKSYEVGLEVVEGIVETGVPESSFSVRKDGKYHVDIGAAVAFQLRRMGVGHIVNLQMDTRSDTRLHSYRRDGVHSGRLAGLIVRYG